MIKMDNVSFKYENAKNGGKISEINVEIFKGQVVLLCGESGSGKTTFGRLVNGLIPTYYEGELSGKTSVCGLDAAECELHELAPLVGSVFQNPKSQFYTLLTDTEIVFACENLGINREEILRRFDEVTLLYKMEKILGKSLFAISGGQKQKVACASVSALDPEIYVLDEPTSNLDISAIRELREILLSLKTRGKMILIVEHRLTWLEGVVDRVLYFHDGKIKEDLTANQFYSKPISDLQTMGLRAEIEFEPDKRTISLNERLVIDDFVYRIKGRQILNIKHLELPRQAVIAVLGNNGMGKSTFAKCLCGLLKKAKGTLNIHNEKFDYKKRRDLCYMVMQDVNHQLFSESVIDDVTLGINGDEENKKEKACEILKGLNLDMFEEAHPMSLSGGQRQRVAIAGAIASHKEILIYDEPTSGLDYKHMREVVESLNRLSQIGKTQFVITHDPELVAACCNYFIFIENGEVVAQGEWTKENVKKIKEYFG